VGGVIAQPNLISQVKPQYPAAARALGIEGFVQLQAIIGTDGVIGALQVDPNGPGTEDIEFIRAAMDAVRQWRYKPGMLNGSAIEIATTITVNFSLQ
jgi:protein TonB